jgi:prolipoprotein diacylglyceryltransferase
VASSLAVGIAVGRTGCFLAGPADHTAENPTSLPCGIAVGDGVRRHPVALDEIAFLLLLLPLPLRVGRSGPSGNAFRLFAGAYLAFRLAVDFVKPDPPPIAGGFSAIQWACVTGLTAVAWGELRGETRVAVAVGP